MTEKGKRTLSAVLGLLLFLFWRIDSWICSLPAWITLILHFTAGLSIWWFWGTLGVWILSGFLRYLIVLFARWGSSGEPAMRENKNPYSNKGIR